MTTYSDGDILHAVEVNQILANISQLQAAVTAVQNGITAVQDAIVPTFYRGGLAATVPHTSGRYKSLKASNGAGENLAPSWAGDCITGLVGVFDITACTTWPVNATGQRIAGLALNPAATAVDSTITPTGVLIDAVSDAEGDASPSCTVGPIRVRLAATDTLMFYGFQDSGASLTIATSNTRTWLNVARVGA